MSGFGGTPQTQVWDPWGNGSDPQVPPVRGSRTTLWVLLGILAGLVALVLAALVWSGLSGPPAGPAFRGLPPAAPTVPASAPPAPESIPAPGSGTVIFDDDFTQPSTGWSTAALPSGTRASYGTHGYTVVGVGTLHHDFYSPHDRAAPSLTVTMTAAISSATRLDGGFGVVCGQGTGAQRVLYLFVLRSDGEWYIERSMGLVTTSTHVTVLKSGTALARPGARPVTVVGMCLGSEGTTRLALFAGGVRLGDVTEAGGAVNGLGWNGGLVTESVAGASSTVVVSHYTERSVG